MCPLHRTTGAASSTCPHQSEVLVYQGIVLANAWIVSVYSVEWIWIDINGSEKAISLLFG